MVQILLGITLALFLFLQVIIRKRTKVSDELVLYDRSSFKGKLFSFIQRLNLFKLIIIGILVFIVSTLINNYRIVTHISKISLEGEHEKANNLLDEYKSGFLPMIFSKNLRYNNNIQWLTECIEEENWKTATVPIDLLIAEDSIPQFMLADAFTAYSKSIRDTTQTFFNCKDYTFRELSSLDGLENWEVQYLQPDTLIEVVSVLSYKAQLRNMSIPEKSIETIYYLFNQLSKSLDIKSIYALASETREYYFVLNLLRTDNQEWIRKFLLDYSINPIIISNHNKKFINRKVYNSAIDLIQGHNDSMTIAVVELEEKLLALCNEQNIITANTIKRGMIDLPDRLLFNPTKSKRLAISNSSEYFENYRYIEQIHWLLNNITEDNFFASLEILLQCPTNLDLGIYLDEFIHTDEFENILKSIELRPHQNNELATFLIVQAERLAEGRQYLRAIRLFELFIYFKTKHFKAEETDGETLAHIYSRIASCKWNIKPFGPKLGFCDDLRKAIDYSNDDWYLTKYLNRCN